MANTDEPTRSRLISTLGGIAATAFVLGPLTAFLGIVPPLVGFYMFGLGGLLGLVTLLVAIVKLVRAGFTAAAPGLAIGGVISLLFILLAVPARQFPPINDITTDPHNPPNFVHAGTLPENAGRDMSYPGESFTRQQQAGYPDLQPLQIEESPEAAYQLALKAAEAMPHWQLTRQDPSSFAIEGFATSRLFRFKDDFVIEIRPAGTGSVVQMRSKSRDGRGDVGANAARIEAFFAKLQG